MYFVVYMDERDANNSSPIHLASAKGNVHIIEALFELGININIFAFEIFVQQSVLIYS